MPGIYVGTSEIKNIYVGTTPVKEVYVGTTKVRPSVTPITTSGIYRDETDGLISMSSDGSNWLTIADKNLGATQVWGDGDTLSEANCGKYYQWGNNYGFPRTGTISNTSSSQVNASDYGPGDYYSSDTFIKTNGAWDSSNNQNLWGGVTGTNAAMQGPCDSGYHIPTNTERQTIYTIRTSLGGGSSDDTNFRKSLKLPFAGSRVRNTAAIAGQGTSTYCWSSIKSSSSGSYALYVGSSDIRPQYNISNTVGASVRPFKNEAVQPDASRTKLY